MVAKEASFRLGPSMFFTHFIAELALCYMWWVYVLGHKFPPRKAPHNAICIFQCGILFGLGSFFFLLLFPLLGIFLYLFIYLFIYSFIYELMCWTWIIGYLSTQFTFKQNGNSSAQCLCERRLALPNLPQPNWHIRKPKLYITNLMATKSRCLFYWTTTEIWSG
jgi:hypothetical protein